jgi:hypothetical protein
MPRYLNSSNLGVNLVALVAVTVLLTACESRSFLLSPTPLGTEGAGVAASQSEARCVNVFAEGAAPLGFVALPNGTAGFGGVWSPVTLGEWSGEMASVVTNQEMSGEQGALHLTLEHAFRLPSGDYFLTRDRAVCAPAGTNPATCRVNDVMTITGGTGVFTNANGSLRNHGVVDFAQNALDFSIRGRVCSDGL